VGLFIYKYFIYQFHCEVSFHSFVVKCRFLKEFDSLHIMISVYSMTKKLNLLLQMVVSNCLIVLTSVLFQATTLISYCSDLQTVIYQFVLMCDSQLCSSAEALSWLPWFHHRKGTFLFSGMFGQIRRPRNWNKNNQQIIWILNTKKKRKPSNSTHLNNDINMVRFNEEVANFTLCG